MLWSRKDDEALDDETYEHITSHVVKAKVGRKGYICALQMVIESPDNTYDFIPFIADMS